MADALDFALAGLPPDTRLADLIAMQAKPSAPPAAIQLQPPKRVVRDVMTPEQQAAVSQPDPAAPIAPTALPQVKPSSYVDQYRQMMSSQVPGRPMSSYGVEPTFNTPERDQATKTLSTPAPKWDEHKPGFWRTMLGAAASGMAAYAHNPNAQEIGLNVVNAPYNRAFGEWATNQRQAQDVLSEQDKQYGTQAANWRNFLTLQQRNDAVDQRERDSVRRDEDRNRALDLREQAMGKDKPQALPKTYEDAVSQWALETDPTRKAALKKAVDEMRNTEIRKFNYKEGGNSDDKPKRGSPYQFSRVQRDMNTDLQKLEREYRRGTGRFDGLDPSSDEARDALVEEKQKIQDNYEQQIVNLGGDVKHYEYPDAGSKPQSQAKPAASSPAPQSKSAPAEVERKLVGPDGKPLTAVVRNGRWVNKATGKPL